MTPARTTRTTLELETQLSNHRAGVYNQIKKHYSPLDNILYYVLHYGK